MAGAGPFYPPDLGSPNRSGDQVGAIVVAVAAMAGVIALFATGHPILGAVVLLILVVAVAVYYIRKKG